MKISRRKMLKGAGGVAVALPLLESHSTSRAAPGNNSFAVFFRQANGVAAAGPAAFDGTGAEPERFWPDMPGPLGVSSVAGKALDELTAYLNRLLVVRVNTSDYNLGEGHARGAVQSLTGIGPTSLEDGTSALANGESIDHRIGRALNPGGRDSLFQYSGPIPGFLGGPCISYRAPGRRRTPFSNPWLAFQFVTGGGGNSSKTKSLNDLVRAELSALLASPTLSVSDKRKLDLHFTSIRDLEVNMSCVLAEDQTRLIETGSGVFTSRNGEDLIKLTELHMDVAVLAIACGQTRSVAIQFGSGNDGSTRFLDPDSGKRMENFHFISHRIFSDGEMGEAIPGADLQHHKIDRYFGKMFKHLLDKLDSHPMPGGGTLLDAGISCWFNDLGNGPGHSPSNVPWVIAGSAGGALKQGQYIIPGSGTEVNHPRLLSTLGAAVGVTNANNSPLDDFGDPTLPKGRLTELLVTVEGE